MNWPWLIRRKVFSEIIQQHNVTALSTLQENTILKYNFSYMNTLNTKTNTNVWKNPTLQKRNVTSIITFRSFCSTFIRTGVAAKRNNLHPLKSKRQIRSFFLCPSFPTVEEI